MIKNSYLLPLATLAGSIVVAVWLFVQKEPPEVRDTTLPTMLVDVMVAEPGSAQIVVAAQGNVIPKTQTTIVSEVSGLIVEVSSAFVAGGFFQKGDVLVRIDNRNYRAEVKRAEASVAAAETKVTQELGLADYAEQDWERAKSSLNSSKAASDLALRKPQVAEAIANLEFAKADLEKRRGDLDRTSFGHLTTALCARRLRTSVSSSTRVLHWRVYFLRTLQKFACLCQTKTCPLFSLMTPNCKKVTAQTSPYLRR